MKAVSFTFFCSPLSSFFYCLSVSLFLCRTLLFIFCCSTFFLLFFHFYFSLCPSIHLSPPSSGVARVKLTRPDKDNSLTHAAVYFSPPLFPLLLLRPSVIPHSSLLHPAILPCLMVSSISAASTHLFYPPLFSPLVGNPF